MTLKIFGTSKKIFGTPKNIVTHGNVEGGVVVGAGVSVQVVIALAGAAVAGGGEAAPLELGHTLLGIL